ncbi:MAG: molybdopterin adenylyltransferase [Paracoccaceae bacterium]|jgi:molybdopterin adenylyltransferase
MTVKIGILTVSDRASRGEYEDKGGPAAQAWLKNIITSPIKIICQIVPDGRASVAAALINMADQQGIKLILVTGGTGPSPLDQTPEALVDVIDKELYGFGELMRQVSLAEVPTAILSRQSAGIRGKTLIITLPGKPSAISTCMNAVFPAVPYCLDLMGSGWIETDAAILKAFRPAK